MKKEKVSEELKGVLNNGVQLVTQFLDKSPILDGISYSLKQKFALVAISLYLPESFVKLLLVFDEPPTSSALNDLNAFLRDDKLRLTVAVDAFEFFVCQDNSKFPFFVAHESPPSDFPMKGPSRPVEAYPTRL